MLPPLPDFPYWSPRFPHQPGWYWTSSNNLAPQIVHVTAIGASGAPMAFDDMGAYVVTADWWLGPIPVPDLPKAQNSILALAPVVTIFIYYLALRNFAEWV